MEGKAAMQLTACRPVGEHRLQRTCLEVEKTRGTGGARKEQEGTVQPNTDTASLSESSRAAGHAEGHRNEIFMVDSGEMATGPRAAAQPQAAKAVEGTFTSVCSSDV